MSMVKKQSKTDKLHDAFVTISESDINYLSYEGQEKWNKLAANYEKKLKHK